MRYIHRPVKRFQPEQRLLTSEETLECTAGHNADGVDVYKTRYTDRSGMVPRRGESKVALGPSFLMLRVEHNLAMC